MQGGVASIGLDVDIHGVACHVVHVMQEAQEGAIVMLNRNCISHLGSRSSPKD